MTKFNTDTEVATSTSITQKLAIGLIMFGALTVGFAAVFALPVFNESKIKIPKAVSYKPFQLTDGAPSTTSLKDSEAAEFEFLRDGIVMATYNKSNNSVFKENKNLKIGSKNPLTSFFFKEASAVTLYSIEDIGGSFQPEDNPINPASKSPLQIKISQSVLETAEIPALTFSLVTDIGNKTFCLPANNINQSTVVSYYYDIDGTPYFDKTLKQKAMNGACRVNTIAYSPTTISEINFNEPYPENIPDGFGIYFGRYDQSMFVMTSNSFQKMTPDDELDFVEGGKAPFVMSPGYYDATQAEITVPARLYTVTSDLGTNTLCFPEQTIAGEWDEGNQRYFNPGIPYYYDTNGTPYMDVLLTNMATTKPCNELLANAFKPYQIFNATSDSSEDFMGAGHFSLNSVDLGSLYFTSNTFNGTYNSSDEGDSPLLLDLKNDESDAHTFSAHTINLEYAVDSSIGGESNHLTICLPETLLAGDLSKSYFYDTNGTPYTDALLENKVTCEVCSDGTLLGQCNSSAQYCDPGTATLVLDCNQCNYTCPASTPYCETSGACTAKCNNGTAASACSGTQYCDPLTLELKNICDKCGYECEPEPDSKDTPVIAQ